MDYFTSTYITPTHRLRQWTSTHFFRFCFAPIDRRLASFNSATAEALVATLIGEDGNIIPSNIVLTCPEGSYGLVSFGGAGHAFEALNIGTQVSDESARRKSISVVNLGGFLSNESNFYLSIKQRQ